MYKIVFVIPYMPIISTVRFLFHIFVKQKIHVIFDPDSRYRKAVILIDESCIPKL